MTRATRIFALALSAGFCVPAFGAIQWTFSGNNPPTNGCPGSGATNVYGNCATWDANSGTPAPDVQARAFSDTSSGSNINTAYVAIWSGGLGVVNRTEDPPPVGTPPSVGSPNHSLDSGGTDARHDAILLSFKSATNASAEQQVALTGLSIGWPDNNTYDTDLTVLAWTAGGAPSLTNLSGTTYASLVSNGWKFVGNYANVPKDTNISNSTPSTLVNGATNLDTLAASSVSSAYWLVAAYNSSIPLPAGYTNPSNLGDGNDYSKLLAAYGVQRQVPEPGGLGLVLLAVAGATARWGQSRKRKQP